jgi:hypothetical protein
MARRSAMKVALFVCFGAAAFAGCDRQTVPLFEGDGGPLPQLTRLEIRPGSARVVAKGQPTTFVFRAIGTVPEGERDVTDLVSWEIEGDPVGSVVSGLFSSPGTIGGIAQVEARLGAISAEASLTVFLDLEAVAPGAPLSAPDLFSDDLSGDDTRTGPQIIYPSDETIFPMNVSWTLFQWRAERDQSLFEVRFDSAVAKVRYYTPSRNFLVDENTRDWLPRTHPGRSLTMTVRSLATTSTGTIHRSEPIRLEYSASRVGGNIYYWSTGAAAIMRAAIDSPRAEVFYPGDSDDTCASCHAISRDGRKIALAYGGERLRVASVPERTLIPSGPADRKYGWGSFDPSGTKLLVAQKGLLELVDLSDGSSTPVPLPNGIYGTHPDWSPSGGRIALAVVSSAPGNKEVKGSSLGLLTVNSDGTFGPLAVLIASTEGEDTIAFPSWSPDGEWIAFVRTRGKSKDSKPAELYLVRADGSGAPILLERLNRHVGPLRDVRSIASSMPTWAPSSTAETSWIAFSSIRDYGDVLVDTDRDQLWASAIDLGRAAAGQDPSAPAFWLPFQAAGEGNHRAFWSVNPEDVCPGTIEICDGADNDCDGTIDDDCCTASAEICGDGLDNDCDGARDEGCGCSATEMCSNRIDDDCDGLTDLDDEDCVL